MEKLRFHLVRHNAFGLGLVLSKNIKGELLNIYFANEFSTKNIMTSYSGMTLDPDLALDSFIQSGLYEKMFDDATKNRALPYANKYAIKIGFQDEHSCSGTIWGSYDYDFKIELKEGEGISLSCSCPVGGPCKHLYALFLYLKKEKSLAQQTPLENKINHYFSMLNSRASHPREFCEFIREVSEGALLLDVYRATSKTMDYSRLSKLVLPTLLIDNKNLALNQKIAQENSDFSALAISNEFRYENLLLRKRGQSQKDIFDFDLILATYNKNIDELLKCLESKSYSYSYVQEALDAIISYAEVNHLSIEDIAKIHSLSFFSYIENEASYRSKKSKYKDELSSLFLFPSENLLSNKNLGKVSANDLLYLLSREQRRNPFLLEALDLKFAELSEIDYRMVALAMIHNMDLDSNYYEKDSKTLIQRIVVNLPNHLFLSFYGVNNKSRSMTKLPNKKEPLEFLLKSQDTFSKEEYDAFYTYFDLVISSSCDENAIFAIEASCVGENVFSINFYQDGQYLIVSGFPRKYDEKIIGILLEGIEEKKQEEFDKLYHEFLTNAKNYRYKKDNDAFFRNVFEIIKKNEEEENAFLEEKIKLIMMVERLENEQFKISFRIGKEKNYKLSNPISLLSHIRNHDYVSYGKSLAFAHYISNFELSAQRVIHYLEKSGYFSEINGYECLNELLSCYPGEEIFIDGLPYYVEPNALNCKIKMKEDGSFSLETKQSLEELSDVYFIVDNKRIAKANDNETLNQFAHNVERYPFARLEKGLEEFQFAILSKYGDSFVLDEGLQKKLGEGRGFRIDSYFDYEEGKLKHNYKIYSKDKEISLSSLTGFQRHYFENYQSKIAAFGFQNGLIQEEDEIWQFLNASLDDLKRYGEVFLSENLNQRKTSVFNLPSLSIRRNEDSSMLDVFLEESPYDEKDLFAIYQAIRKKKRFVALKGEFISISNEEATSFAQLASEFNLVENKTVVKKKKLPLYCGFKSIGDETGAIHRDEYIEDIFSQIKNFNKAKIEMPKINGKLRNYQESGVKWLSILYQNHLGGILADDMGLGKSLETIVFLKLIHPKNPVLIVSPKSLLFNWKNEFAKFDPEAKVVLINGDSAQRKKLFDSIDENNGAIYLISYETLRNEITKLKTIHFDTCLLDEAQFIKNVNAKKTNAVKEIQSTHSFALTGTPIENNIGDLWSIFDFLMPNYLLELKEFLACFQQNKDYTKTIKTKIAPFILRRSKKDVLKDLPPKYEILYSVEMGEKQKKLYEAVRHQVKILSDNNANSLIQMLTLLTRLRQICIDPSLYIENYDGESAKMDALKEIIEKKINEGHRILVFSQFVKALVLLETLLKKMGISYSMITGDTSAKKRLEICEEFNEKEDTKVVLISLKAGGTGLNLTGADTVIHLDPWWNYAAESQASDRAHRIGQKRNVEIIKLICENSVEQKIIALQNEKKSLSEKLISEGEEAIKKLSIADLKKILSL